jgi:DNA-binding NarL/FixJ family response regulator
MNLSSNTCPTWQAGFVALLPAIQRQARYRFRSLTVDDRDEAIAETVAAACVAYRALHAQGRLHLAYPSTLASFAGRHTAEHRHVGGHATTRDVMSPAAQRRHGFDVVAIPGDPDPRVARRRDYTPADHAAFRIDFADWLRRRSRREQSVIRRLVSGERPGRIADRLGVTPARISQLRRELERSWHAQPAA